MFKQNTCRSFALLIAFAVVVLDQISKWLMTEMILRPHSTGQNGAVFFHWITKTPTPLSYTEIPLLPFFKLVMVWNRGVSFGMLNQGQAGGGWGLVAIALIVCVLFVVWLMRSQSRVQCFSIALVLGGALGNVIDRARFGAVIDFLDFHAGSHHWPAFNVADSAVVVGVILLIIHSIFLENKPEKRVDLPS